MSSECGEGETREGQLREARTELERLLYDGHDGRAEDVLARFPNLATEPDYALELIYTTEFTIRTELGQTPLPEDYYARFPQWRSQLERQFQIHDLLYEPHAEPLAVLGSYQLVGKIGQ